MTATLKNTIRDGGSTALKTADTVDTVDTVDAVDMVYTVDMTHNEESFHALCLVPMFQWERLAEG